MLQYQQRGYENQRWGLQRSVQDTVSTPVGGDVFHTENSVYLAGYFSEALFYVQIYPDVNRIRGYGEFRLKRTLQIVIAMSFLAMFLISPVAAATSEGLEWGVALNDEFTFQFKVIEAGETILDEGVNFTVESTPPTIDDPLTNWTNLDYVDVDLVYTNGSSIGFEGLYLLGIIIVGGGFAVPIGNFTLLTELIMNSIIWTENHTIVNDGTNWGARMSETDDEMAMQVYVHYLKADGFIARYTLDSTNTTSGESYSVTLIRDGLGLDIIGLLSDNILFVGIGVGAIVIIGAVVCIRRK